MHRRAGRLIEQIELHLGAPAIGREVRAEVEVVDLRSVGGQVVADRQAGEVDVADVLGGDHRAPTEHHVLAQPRPEPRLSVEPPPGRQLADEPINLCLAPHVHAARRLIEQENVSLLVQHAANGHLLLIAPAQVADRQLQRRGSHPQTIHHGFGSGRFLSFIDEAQTGHLR